MTDTTEGLRREERTAINSGAQPVEGQTWTTDELTRDFEIIGFLAPYVVVCRKSDGVRGTLKFRHDPRVYFDFSEEGA